MLDPDEKYCVGFELTLADINLVPQIYNAIGVYRMNIEVYPKVWDRYTRLMKIDEIGSGIPERQPDCPEEFKLSS
jgi:maleylpyruvate isomerase